MSWQVFYTPHTDDESIGMGGAIARAVDSGDDVLVVLVTDNVPSHHMRNVFNNIDLHEHRRSEWQRAMLALGVTQFRAWEIQEALPPFTLQAQIEQQMEAVHDELRPTLHHTVWGGYDVHIESGYGSWSHAACANALIRLAMRRRVHGLLYAVYEYAKPMSQRVAPIIRTMTEAEFQRKRSALQCYKEGLGYGYRSVPELIDHAMGDANEYIVEIGT